MFHSSTHNVLTWLIYFYSIKWWEFESNCQLAGQGEIINLVSEHIWMGRLDPLKVSLLLLLSQQKEFTSRALQTFVSRSVMVSAPRLHHTTQIHTHTLCSPLLSFIYWNYSSKYAFWQNWKYWYVTNKEMWL